MTSNIELMDYAKELNLNIGVAMRDEIFKDKHSALDGLIVNLQTSELPGSHWVMMSRKHQVYYDSYGLPPILEAFQYLQRNFQFTAWQTQPVAKNGQQTLVCGQLCLWVLSELSTKSFTSIIRNLS